MRLRRWRLLLVLILVGGPALFFILAESGSFNTEFWTRDQPLVNPIRVAAVADGVITLTDGRSFKAAGIRRREDVEPAEFDSALRAVTAQGILVTRDLGDGRAVMLAEPKFYNWCGTRNYEGHSPWAHWAGLSVPCGVSETLVFCAYTIHDPDDPGLSPKERWAIEGAAHLRSDEVPRKIVEDSFRIDGSAFDLANLEEMLAATWQPPPPR